MMVSSRSLSRLVGLSLTVGLALSLGCDGGPRSSVKGKVTFEGEPVDDGGIMFLPIGEDEGERVRATGDIRGGEYFFDSQSGPNPGKHRVEIYWYKKTGRKIKSEGGNVKDEFVPGLPPRFNEKSDLTADVQRGRNTIEFDLKK